MCSDTVTGGLEDPHVMYVALLLCMLAGRVRVRFPNITRTYLTCATLGVPHHARCVPAFENQGLSQGPVGTDWIGLS
jgi:hypothetical protein